MIPFLVTETWRGLDTMDLILDLTIDPTGTPEWKDRTDYDEALHRGLIAAETAAALTTESTRVLTRQAAAAGPFDPTWINYTPTPGPLPTLPPPFRTSGTAWNR